MRTVEIIYLRSTSTCGVSRWGIVSNEDVYERLSMSVAVKGGNLGMAEWLKHGT